MSADEIEFALTKDLVHAYLVDKMESIISRFLKKVFMLTAYGKVLADSINIDGLYLNDYYVRGKQRMGCEMPDYLRISKRQHLLHAKN